MAVKVTDGLMICSLDFQNGQKQPFKVFFTVSVFKSFCKIYRKIPVLESLFNKIARFRSATLIKRDKNFSVNFANFLKAPL